MKERKKKKIMYELQKQDKCFNFETKCLKVFDSTNMLVQIC